MSILLEALKKSEQERQLGQTPTLQTRPDEPLQSNAPLNQWIILSMVVLSACVMAWFGWQQFREPLSAEAPVVVAQAGEDVAAPVEEARPQERTMTELYKRQDGKSASPGAEPPGRTDNEPADRDSLSRSVSNYTAENDEPALAEQTENVAVITEPSPAADSLPAEAEAPPPVEEQTRRRGLEPHVAEPISYWELPQGIRDDLPPIKISVLVYAEQPHDRFLLSNGQRLVEKDELDNGLVLDEIRKDGAIFLYRNYRFLVKG
jgi:general secretion pathway protein B